MAPASVAVEPRLDRATAVVEISRLGGKVTVDENSPGEPIVAVDFSGTAITDVGLKSIKSLGQFQQLDVSLTKVTDEGLVNLRI